MFRRDYIKDEIDRFGEFLRKLLERILQMEGVEPIQVYQVADKELTEVLNLSLKKQKVLSKKEFLQLILSETNSINSIEILAEVYYQLAKKGSENNEMTQSILQKSMALYEHVLEHQDTLSFQAHQRVDEIRQIID